MGHTQEAELVRRFYGKAWNRWDDTVVDELLAEDFAFRGSLGDEVHGRSGWRAYRDAVRSAIPDFHNEIVELIVAPGQAAARLRYTGHHHGVLLGEQGSGAAIEYEGAALFSLRRRVPHVCVGPRRHRPAPRADPRGRPPAVTGPITSS